MAFLDCTVNRASSKFNTSVFRKSTFTGLGTSFFSFCSFRFKVNGLITLLYRAYRISSDYCALNCEFDFLRDFFVNNGFPANFVESAICKFLYSKRNNFLSIPTVEKKKCYLSLPYFGAQSDKLKRELESLLLKYFGHLDFKIILVNSFRIGSLFKCKDVLPKVLRSNVIYEFSCGQCPSQVYLGCTSRCLGVRISEHEGTSHRTGNPLTRPVHSAIRDHIQRCSGAVSPDQFRILASSRGIDLKILESLFIFKRRPILNDMNSSFPLAIVNS